MSLCTSNFFLDGCHIEKRLKNDQLPTGTHAPYNHTAAKIHEYFLASISNYSWIYCLFLLSPASYSQVLCYPGSLGCIDSLCRAAFQCLLSCIQNDVVLFM